MMRWGCIGTIAGVVIGTVIIALVAFAGRPNPPPAQVQPTLPPDASIFISERSLSRVASETLGQPALIETVPNGQIQVTTRAQVGQFEPVVEIGLLLEMQDTEAVSRLHWIKLGFIVIPARWLPQSAQEAAGQVGQMLTTQMPPNFRLIGLSTTTEGINFHMKWIGN